jgi:hypothetical protein
MKKKQLLMVWGIIFVLFPMSEINAAEPNKVSILLMTNLGSASDDNTIALSSDGGYIFAGTYKAAESNVTLIKVPDSFTAEPEVVWKIDVEHVFDVEISSNASRLVYCDDFTDSIVCLSKTSITPVWDLTPATGSLSWIDLSENGEYLIYVYHDAGTYNIKGVNAADNSVYWTYESMSNIMGLDVSNNGKFVASLGNGSIFYFDTDGFVWNKTAEYGTINPRLNEDGSRVLVSDQTGDESISLYDGSGTLLWTFSDERLSNQGYDLARTSVEVIVATYDNAVHLNNKMYGLNGSSATPVWTLNTGIPQNIARISADGRIGMVSDYEDTVHLLDMATGDQLMTHTLGAELKNIAISDDGTIAAALDLTGTLVVYAIEFADDTGDGSPDGTGLLDNFINGFTNLDNIYSLGATLVVGLMLGGLLFRRRKK